MQKSPDWFGQGVSFFEDGKYDEAVSAFNKAITCNQSLVDAWCNRGLVYAQMGNYQQALQSLEQTLALDPSHENAQKARGMVLALMEKEKQRAPAVQYSSWQSYEPSSAPIKNTRSENTGSRRSPVLAALFGFLFPGWGQWYDGKRWEGLAFLGAAILTGMLMAGIGIFTGRNSPVLGLFPVISLAIGLISMYHAYTTARGINRGEIPFSRKSRLFWLPVIVYAGLVILLVLTLGLAFVFAGRSAG